MRINPMNTSQFALQPGQVSPIAGALQQAPQYMQSLQSAQQSMAQTHIKAVQAAFASPQAQALLAKAQADAGVAQASQHVAMSTIGAHIANAKAITAGNQYLAAKQHADAITAAVGANVAQQTAGQKVAQAKAATTAAQAGAQQQVTTAKMLPNTIRAERLGLVQPTIVAGITHPFNAQVHPAPAVKGGEAGAAAAGNQFAQGGRKPILNSNKKIPETNSAGIINGYKYTKTRMKNGIKQYFINGHYYSVAPGK